MTRSLVIGEHMPRFAFLLAAMCLELMLSPLLEATPAGMLGARIITSIVLLAALVAVGSRSLALVLFAAAVLSHVLATVTNHPGFLNAAPIFRFVFLCYVLVLLLEHVMRDRNVSYDTIAGAACGYMLLGLIWGDLFILTQQWRPGSFDVPSSFVVGAASDQRPALLYFSFSTLTTVGYGEVHPNNAGAGGLAVAEAVIGQLYLAVTISRLVGLHISDRGK